MQPRVRGRTGQGGAGGPCSWLLWVPIAFLAPTLAQQILQDSDGELNCDHPQFVHHLKQATFFYEVRQNLRRKLPYDFEDPVHAYPEAFDISLLLREEEMVNLILQSCPEALALEKLLQAERHLSLMARTTQPSELYENATQACEHSRSFQELQMGFGFQNKYEEMLRMGSEHLMNTWLRLGLRADTFCARLKDFNTVRLDIGEVGFHPECRIPRIQAESRSGELLQGCYVEGMWKDLPEAKRCLGWAVIEGGFNGL